MKFIRFAFVGLMALMAFSSCKNDEMKYDVMGNDGLVYARIDASNSSAAVLNMKVSNTKFGVFGADSKVPFFIRSTMPVKGNDVMVSFDVNNSLIEEYNKENGTKYVQLNADLLLFNTSAIKIGSTQCAIEFSLNEEAVKGLELGEYLVPLTLKVVSGEMTVSKLYNTVYIHLTVNDDISDLSFGNRDRWTIADCSSEEIESEDAAAKYVLDGDVNTYWRTCRDPKPAPPHSITIDMNEVVGFIGFQYFTRISNDEGIARDLRVEVSLDNETWTEIGTYDEYSDDMPWDAGEEFKIMLEESVDARYFRYTINKSYNNYVAIAEINAYTVKK